MRRITQGEFNAKAEAADGRMVLRYSQTRTRYGIHVQLHKGLSFETWFVGVALDENCKSIIEWLG